MTQIGQNPFQLKQSPIKPGLPVGGQSGSPGGSLEGFTPPQRSDVSGLSFMQNAPQGLGDTAIQGPNGAELGKRLFMSA